MSYRSAWIAFLLMCAGTLVLYRTLQLPASVPTLAWAGFLATGVVLIVQGFGWLLPPGLRHRVTKNVLRAFLFLVATLLAVVCAVLMGIGGATALVWALDTFHIGIPVDADFWLKAFLIISVLTALTMFSYLVEKLIRLAGRAQEPE